MNPSGKKQVREAILIAGLSALVTGVVQWGVEAYRVKCEAQMKMKRKKRKKKTP